jgi:hypothetical protein
MAFDQNVQGLLQKDGRNKGNRTAGYEPKKNSRRIKA